jgi:hypothetical protein
MISTRWYCGLLEGLPQDSRRRLSAQLRRSLRAGCPPSRRAWRAMVEGSLYGYRARV